MSYFFRAADASFHFDDAPVPADSVPISNEVHAALMAAHAAGKQIAADADGQPIAIDPPPLSPERVARLARQVRGEALARSDWRVMPDSPLSTEQRAAWVAYRQALRDWPEQPGWPGIPVPTPPG